MNTAEVKFNHDGADFDSLYMSNTLFEPVNLHVDQYEQTSVDSYTTCTGGSSASEVDKKPPLEHLNQLDFLASITTPNVDFHPFKKRKTEFPRFPTSRVAYSQISQLGQIHPAVNFPSFYRNMKRKVCDVCSASVSRFAVKDVNVDYLMDLPIVLKEGNGCRHWTTREETFLIGIIFDMLYRRGSLAPTKAQRSLNDVCWERIKKMFDTASARYTLMTRSKEGESICQTRTLHAIVRHFKVMKANLAEEDTDEDSDELPLFKKLHREWEDNYNQCKILTCSPRKFQAFMKKMKILSAHTCVV